MENNAKNAVFFIDEDYQLLYVNDATRAVHPAAEPGMRCYEALARGSAPCAFCPLKCESGQSTFFDAVRRERVRAQASRIDLPPYGDCFCMTVSPVEETIAPKTGLHRVGSIEMSDGLRREIVDAMSCGVIAYTLPDRKLLAVNDAVREMIGCGPEDDPIQALHDFLMCEVVPEERENVLRAGEALKQDGDTVIRDYRAEVGGKLIHIHSNIRYLHSSDGQPYILVTMLNTTEQARLARVAEKERKAYREALENGSEFSFLMDVTEGMILEEFVTAHGVNLVKALGLTVPVSFDEVMKKYEDTCHIEFSSEEMHAHFRQRGLLDAYQGGVTNVITEYYNPVRDIYFRVNCLLSRDEDNGHIFASIVANDVTEIRKKDKLQQEALKAAYNEMDMRMSTILRGLSGGFKIACVDEDYRYTYISEGAAQLQGYTVEEFMEKYGHRVTSNIFPSEGEAALEEANRQIREKGSYEVKYRVPHRDGSIKWVIDRGKSVEDPATGKKYLYILMQDITNLEERNMQLSNVLNMQEHMADSVGSGIFAYTVPEHEVLILNQEAKKMFASIGSDEKMNGRDINSKIVPEDMTYVRKAVNKLGSPRDSIKYTFHAMDLEGQKRTFQCNTKLLKFPSGQKYIISAIVDITEQKLTELRLETERQRYREALTLGCSGCFSVDLTKGILDENVMTGENAALMHKLHMELPVSYDDFAAEWLSDKRILSGSEQVAVARSRDALIEAYRSGTTMLDLEYNTLDGNKYFHLMTLLYKSGENVHATFFLYDITADRSDEKKRQAIISSLGEIYTALYHFSLQNDDCTMVKKHWDIEQNPAIQKSFSEFRRQYPGQYVEEEYRDAVRDFLDPEQIRIRLKDAASAAIEFKRKNMGWCRVDMVAAGRNKEGEVTEVVFAGARIDEEKQRDLAQQEALRAAYEAANIANAAKTSFLANMSHDIRTPMNAIIGMTAIAGTHLDDTERVANCLGKISLSSKHLLGIINDVLDMSKIESGKIDLQEEEFNITDLIENLVSMSKSEIDSKGHELSVFIRGIHHENVIGDSQRLQQVFMNLMSNAVKYTPYGGKIKLTVTEKETARQQFGHYEFVIEDNGIGMSEEFLSQIFEPFTRATDDPRVDRIQGTGLGMAITKNIIQMMSGEVKVESKLNVGTTVTVSFFLNVKSEAEADEDYAQFAHLPVLVVDDDEDSCLYACNLLDEIGMDGEWVLSGEEAVEKVTRRNERGDDYFAVILDWKMPGMDGVETTKEIRRRIGKSVPIIIISAYDWSEIELAARAAGANAFVSKPMFKSRVAHVFNELMGEEKEKKPGSALDALYHAGFAGKRALLVEDNALNAEIAGEILTMAGFAVEFAVNGKEAVDIMTNVEDGHFDVVFMDIQMPIMNGYEATRAIRSLPGDYAKSVPIFAMTANDFAEDISAAKSAGMNEHIAKPMDFDQLTVTLKKWLG